MNLADVSVVVPTKNEVRNLPGFVASLPREVELVAVDASDDGTPELLARLRPARTRVVLSRARIAEARQIGAGAARGGWVLFTDGDVAFEPGYFDELARPELDPRCGGVVGTKGSRLGHALYWRLFRAGQRLCALAGIPSATGSNMLISRAALERVGGFDLELACNEDSEIMWRVARAGFRVRFVPKLRVAELDDRRLARGAARKLLHSATRCALLWLGWLPRRLRRADWGYWREAGRP